jgi:hypothetical protein
MNEQELKQLDNEIVETKKQLVLIDKTIKVLNDIKGMSPIVREGCKENINELINWIYK